VSYHLKIADREKQYLDNLPLSPEASARIKLFVEEFIADVPDVFRNDPENRPDPNKQCFCVRHIIRDRWGDGKLHTVESPPASGYY
jgi:hypothetical protein